MTSSLADRFEAKVDRSGSLLSFGARIELPRYELTRFGQLQPAVRNQIESMIHGAEQGIADAIDNARHGAPEDDH